LRRQLIVISALSKHTTRNSSHFVRFQTFSEATRPAEKQFTVLSEGVGKMATNTTTEKLLTAKAVGQMLSLSKRQIFRLNSCGRIPRPLRIGGSVRWSEHTISKWLAAGAPDRKAFEAMQRASND
jgi:predicted DNA-binding transcriptional regulator AlpA